MEATKQVWLECVAKLENTTARIHGESAIIRRACSFRPTKQQASGGWVVTSKLPDVKEGLGFLINKPSRHKACLLPRRFR